MGFDVPLDTLQVILKTIYTASQLTGAKNWFKPNQTATKLQHKNPRQQLQKHMHTNNN